MYEFLPVRYNSSTVVNFSGDGYPWQVVKSLFFVVKSLPISYLTELQHLPPTTLCDFGPSKY